MLTDFNLLTFFMVACILVTPVFIKVRSGMSRRLQLKPREFKLYTRNKLLQISFSHFFLIITFLLFNLALFFLIKNRSGNLVFNGNDLVFFVVYIVVSFLVSYGAGSYIAAIVIEQCMIKPNQTQPKKYRALPLYNEFFHGPFSHVLSFSGSNFLFFIICLLELNYPATNLNSTVIFLYAIYGAIFGFLFAYWQLWNLTWKHQMPWFLTFFAVHLTFLYYYKVDLFISPFNFLYLFFGICLNTVILWKFFFYRKRKLYYRYNLKFKFDQLFK